MTHDRKDEVATAAWNMVACSIVIVPQLEAHVPLHCFFCGQINKSTKWFNTSNAETPSCLTTLQWKRTSDLYNRMNAREYGRQSFSLEWNGEFFYPHYLLAFEQDFNTSKWQKKKKEKLNDSVLLLWWKTISHGGEQKGKQAKHAYGTPRYCY